MVVSSPTVDLSTVVTGVVVVQLQLLAVVAHSLKLTVVNVGCYRV